MIKMPGHPRLYRRGATYYHRAAIPVDITDTYPKSEETFSLKTKDHREAVRRVRVEAARVDRKFEAHRREQTQMSEPPLLELSETKIKQLGDLYFASLLDEDEETRLEGFADASRPTINVNRAEEIDEILEAVGPRKASFEEHTKDTEWLDDHTRKQYARGQLDNFFEDEADDILSWENVNIRLSPDSPSRHKLARAIQAATIRANDVVSARNRGDVIETPKVEAPSPATDTPLLSIAVERWAEEKPGRVGWRRQSANTRCG